MALPFSCAVAVPTAASSRQAECMNGSFGSCREHRRPLFGRASGVEGLRPAMRAIHHQYMTAAAKTSSVVGFTRHITGSQGETQKFGSTQCTMSQIELKSSRRIFTSLQSCTPFNGNAQSQITGQTGNHERLVVRAGAKRGVGSAGGGQTLDIPFLDEFQLPSFSEVSYNLSQVTPLKAAKWVTIAAVALAATSTFAGLTVFNSNFWMYGSWLGVVWPWPAAIMVGIWTLLAAVRQAKSGTKEEEQVLILGGALVWLILVPLAHAHGFIDGWPILLYTKYYFFFSISAIVRDRMYGTLSTTPEDKKWQSSPQVTQIAFIMAIVGGHWAAAFESPFLVHSWNWAWQSKLAAAVLALSVVVNWNAIYFLGKYSDRLVNPKAVVMFGPYRWVRHPIYSSYMLLCAGYCLALRSYFSLLFLIISSVVYYDQRTKLEEKNLVEVFGTTYTTYKEKTRHKFLPWVY